MNLPQDLKHYTPEFRRLKRQSQLEEMGVYTVLALLALMFTLSTLFGGNP